MNPYRALRLGTAGVLALFFLYFLYEMAFNLPSSFEVFWGEVWGRIVFIDLAIGIVMFSVWVIYREASILRSLPWLASFVVLGNGGTLIYLLAALWPVESAKDLPRFFHGRRIQGGNQS